MSNLFTPANPLPKRQNQWSNAESRLANQDKRLKSILIHCLPNDVMKSVIKYKSGKEMWTELCLAYEGPSDTRDTKIAALRLKFNAFKALEGEKSQCLPRKWLSMNQTQRANNSIKNDSLADSDSDVEEDNRTINEFMTDLNAEYHKRALLANQKRFYKRSGRVGSARKPIEKSIETCFTCGKLGYFKKDCLSRKTLTPSYLSSNNSFNKPRPHTPSFTPNTSQNSTNHQKDYKGKYKGLKAEMAILTQRIVDLTKGKNEKGKSDKGLIAESFDWDDESVSSEDEGTTKFKAFMAIAEDEPSVGKGDARSGQLVEITMKKVYRLMSMTDDEEIKHVLDNTHVDLHYVEDQRKDLVNKFNALKQDLAFYKSELCNLKNTVSINCSLQNEVIKVNLENESLKDEISDLKRRKENNSTKEVVFTKADESLSEPAPMITSNSEADFDIQEPLPPLPKLVEAESSGTSNNLISLSDLTTNMAELTLNTASSKKSNKSAKKVP
ncbi:retrovirus-related pol polyprotein from transposon TNT 1-94 [Tanacetum coccineum]